MRGRNPTFDHGFGLFKPPSKWFSAFSHSAAVNDEKQMEEVPVLNGTHQIAESVLVDLPSKIMLSPESIRFVMKLDHVEQNLCLSRIWLEMTGREMHGSDRV